MDVLLVEDNLGDIDLIVDVLSESAGVSVLVARDGVGALSMMRREGGHSESPIPSLVMLDLNLPKKDGREVLADMKADPRLCHIPVVVLTSSEAESDSLLAYGLQASCYVTKPLDLAGYQAAVRAIAGFWLGVATLPAGPAPGRRETLVETRGREQPVTASLLHDLRNHLAPMLASVSVLGRVPPGSSQATGALDVLDRRIRLMADLLDAYTSQAGDAPDAARSESAAATAATAATAARPSDALRPPTRLRLLVIDDNADAADSLRDTLEPMGVEVRVANRGRDGVAAAFEEPPHVVLCDLGLPDADGYEVARALRAERRFEHTMLVALTGYDRAQDRQRAADAGFCQYLVKPPTLDALRQLLVRASEVSRLG